MDKKDVLIMGIGNYLMGDEGIGVHVVEALQSEGFANADFLEGGTGGFHLFEYFQTYRQVVLVDATLDQQPVGTIRLIKPRFAADFPKAMSTHDIGLKDMVATLQLLGSEPEIYLFVVSIESVQQQGIELTPEIQTVLPVILQKVKKLVQEISEEALV